MKTTMVGEILPMGGRYDPPSAAEHAQSQPSTRAIAYPPEYFEAVAGEDGYPHREALLRAFPNHHDRSKFSERIRGY
jgi:hypothetical protein